MASSLLLFTFPLMLMGLWACESISPVPVSGDELAMLRSEVRRIIRPGCGSCHTSSLRTAKPAALAVFDLARDDWSAEMTKQELSGLQSRTRDIRDTLALKVEALVAAELARSPGDQPDVQH